MNHVGVELNTASAPLLGYVAGIGKSLAKKIVAHRDANGAFARASSSRGPAARAQGVRAGAGFLRIRGGATRSTPRRSTRSATRSSSRSGQTRRRRGGLIGNAKRLRGSTRPSSPTTVRRADAARHPQGAREAGPRPARRVPAATSPTACDDGRPQAGHGPRGRRHERHRVRRVRRHRRPPGRPRPRLGHLEHNSSRTRRGRQVRRRGEGQGPVRRHPAQPHLADHARAGRQRAGWRRPGGPRRPSRFIQNDRG